MNPSCDICEREKTTLNHDGVSYCPGCARQLVPWHIRDADAPFNAAISAIVIAIGLAFLLTALH